MFPQVTSFTRSQKPHSNEEEKDATAVATTGEDGGRGEEGKKEKGHSKRPN